MRFKVDELARHLGARLLLGPEQPPGAGSDVPSTELDGLAGDGPAVGDLVVDGLAIDSRLVQPRQLFAAIRAERDGHDYVEAALSNGAGAVLVERIPAAGAPGPSLLVASVPDALAELARIARRQLSSDGGGAERIVGVTGSVGKTTTKDLLSNVLARRYLTAASEKSFNNELGVPLTLVNAPDGTEAAVIEMGARGVGHIRHLCDLARPTVGVVTVVEAVHTEVMGNIDRIALAKRELVEALPESGAAVLNADDPNVAAMAAHTGAAVVSFGIVDRIGSGPLRRSTTSAPEVRAERVEVDEELRASFVLGSPWGTRQVHLGVRGAHNVTNALAAAAAGMWLGVPIDDVVAGLGAPTASPWRMELVRVEGGPTVLNDAYNAGPASMAAALRALASLPVQGRRVAVLGVMAELGPEGPEEHRRIAALASDLGVEVVAVDCDLYGDGTAAVSAAGDVDRVLAALGPFGPSDAVLVKGSRVAGLEQVAAELIRRGP